MRQLAAGTNERTRTVSNFYARQAAVALLKMAKSTTDPKVAVGLVVAAAALKDQAGELPPPIDSKPDAPPEK